MKNLKVILILSVFMVGKFMLYSQDQDKQPQNNSSAYMLGLIMTRNISDYEFTKEEIDEIIKGFSDGLKNKINYKTAVNYEKVNNLIKNKKDNLTAKNKKKGEEYLKKMASEKNARIIENGIVYLTVTEGKGNTPSENDTVKVNYTGRFIDGTEFDSSYKRGEPATFQLNSVIPCWTKVVSKMKVGEKATVGCPSDTAYGDNGIERVIPPGSTLIFDIELLDIIKKEEKK